MCPKQDLALRIKTAFSRYEPGVTQASIIERTVPSASLSPFRPCDVVAILAVRISRFPGRTKDALSGAAWTGDYVSGYRRGSCQHRNKNGSNANQSEFRHAFLPLAPVFESHRFKLRTTWPPALSLAGRKSLNRPRLAYDPRRLLISRFRRRQVAGRPADKGAHNPSTRTKVQQNITVKFSTMKALNLIC